MRKRLFLGLILLEGFLYSAGLRAEVAAPGAAGMQPGNVAQGSSAPAGACRAWPAPAGLRFEQCTGKENALVRLSLDREDGELDLYAVFPERGGRLFESFSTSEAGEAYLRPSEAARMRELAQTLRATPAASQARALALFLGEFAGTDFPLKDYDLSLRSHSALAGFSMICDRIGRKNAGEFTAFGRSIRVRAVVGSGTCLGKCGAGCGSEPPGQGKYTQECFNHDLCARIAGENMGDCSDEFWAAADGFLSAPYCP